jgi:cell division protein FtsB
MLNNPSQERFMASNLSRANRQRLRVVATGLALLLAFWLVFSPYGVVRYLRIRKQLVQAEQEIRHLQADNLALEDEIERLQNDPSYIEEVARKRFGLIRKNEIIYEFGKKGR